MLRIVSMAAIRIASMELGPVPTIIGIGPMSITIPVVVWAFPFRIDEAMRRAVPTSMKENPRRNIFNGNVNNDFSRFRLL